MNTTKKRIRWNSEDDNILIKTHSLNNSNNWKEITINFNRDSEIKRSITQCKDRYYYSLKPDLNKGKWLKSEEILLLEKVNQYNGNWKKISTYFDKRSIKAIKNKYYLLLKNILFKSNKIIGNKLIFNRIYKLNLFILSNFYQIYNKNMKNQEIWEPELKYLISSEFFSKILWQLYFNKINLNLFSDLKEKFWKFVNDFLTYENVNKNLYKIYDKENNNKSKDNMKSQICKYNENKNFEKISNFFNNLSLIDILQNKIFYHWNYKKYINNIKVNLLNIKNIYIKAEIDKLN